MRSECAVPSIILNLIHLYRAEDQSVRYVAEENIDIIAQGVPHNLMATAGRYFKRWDNEAHCFVSNIRDEYPED